MWSIRSQPLRLGEGREVGAQDGLSGNAELGGDSCPGDDVVAGDHAHLDVGGLGVAHRRLRLLTGRVDHADQAGHLQRLDQGQQVAAGDRSWLRRDPGRRRP